MSTKYGTPEFIKKLTAPVAQKQQSARKIWSIDLPVFVNYFTATSATGDKVVDAAALGAPLRVAYDKDGQVKFSSTGKPIIRIAKELNQAVRDTREQFAATLVAFAQDTAKNRPAEFKAQLELQTRAGQPIVEADKQNLADALAMRELAEQEAAEKAAAEKVAAQPVAPVDQPELVTA
jgi:hypothetical protein